jgi:hypothetical protein
VGTNENPVKSDNSAEREINSLGVALLGNAETANLRRISMFNLRAGIEAIRGSYGGQLVIVAPHKPGDPIEFIYDGMATRR